MASVPNDVFIIASPAALEIADSLLDSLNTIIRSLPEREMREMRNKLEVSFYTADDHLLSIMVSSGFDALSINGASTTPSSVSTATSSHTATTADVSVSPSLPASVTAVCGVGVRPTAPYDDEKVLTLPPTDNPAPTPAKPTYPMIVSSRPNVGLPDYTLHPAFIKPGVPGPYERPPIDASKGNPAAYHVITKGLYIGIFTNWNLCSAWVTKVAGNAHFKVLHWAEAMELYNSCLEAGACEVLS